MSFIYLSDQSKITTPFEYYVGTTDEVFVIGEVVVVTAGLLTKAAVTSAGLQQFVMQEAATGDGSTKLAVIPITPTALWETISTATIATAGAVVTLTAAATGITATATAGVFRVLKTDAVTTTSTVVGRFE